MNNIKQKMVLLSAVLILQAPCYAFWDYNPDDFWNSGDAGITGNWIDEVDVIGIDLSNDKDEDEDDDDWWKIPESEDFDDDNSEFDEEYDDTNNNSNDDSSVGKYHPDNNSTENINNPPFLPNDVHKPVEGEVLFKENLPAENLKQRTGMDCVSTSLGILYSLMGSEQSAEEIRYNIEQAFFNATGEKMYATGVNSNENIETLFNYCGLGFEKISTSDIPSSVDNNSAIVGVIMSDDGTNEHMVVIVGYYDDWDKDAFQCINPGTGLYETHYDYEFVVRDLDDRTIANTYIYRKY